MRVWAHEASPASRNAEQTAQQSTAQTVGTTPNLSAARPQTKYPRELILAGGALKLCSSLAAKECAPDAVAIVGGVREPVLGTHVRTEPRYALSADIVGNDFEQALDPALWYERSTQRDAMRALLQDARGRFATMSVSEDSLRTHFESRCVGPHGQVRSCRGIARSPWDRLDDDHQATLLAALELPQSDGMPSKSIRRKRERASLDGSRNPHGVEILRTFVDAARERLPGNAPTRRPHVAVVTASSFDPFDPVDFYLDALNQAGAEVEWWPVDSAMAAAVFEGRGCDTLPNLRRERLRLPGRERVYPDLAAQQQRACADPQVLANLPDRVQGIFFTGGDQWKLRRAFFDSNDAPNAWLRTLRDAVARGDVVIGGTSAGSAVQSGGPMLSNGTSKFALLKGATVARPPMPGCTRAGDCPAGLDEDAFTYWPDGGLGLAPQFIVDTHFSERAREPRLLRLLVDTCTRYGIGADETSALHLRWREDGSVDIAALGAAGGWVFDAGARCHESEYFATAYYLKAGMRLRIPAHTLTPSHPHLPVAGTDALPPVPRSVPTIPASSDDPPKSNIKLFDTNNDIPSDALSPRALRNAALVIAATPNHPGYGLQAGDTDRCIVLRPKAANVSSDNGNSGTREAPITGTAIPLRIDITASPCEP
jgi:cyanophycinase-like exopeptidase